MLWGLGRPRSPGKRLVDLLVLGRIWSYPETKHHWTHHWGVLGPNLPGQAGGLSLLGRGSQTGQRLKAAVWVRLDLSEGRRLDQM